MEDRISVLVWSCTAGHLFSYFLFLDGLRECVWFVCLAVCLEDMNDLEKILCLSRAVSLQLFYVVRVPAGVISRSKYRTRWRSSKFRICKYSAFILVEVHVHKFSEVFAG